MRNFLKIIALLILPLVVGAEEHEDPTIKEYFGTTPMVGQGTVYKFIIPAYDISLWSKNTPWNFSTLFALQVRCRWDASKTEMIDNTIEVMERDPTLSKSKSDLYRALLSSFYPNLKAGDFVTVIFQPEKNICFYHNGKLLKIIPDMEFAKRFCDIWLGEKTKYQSAREGMLGQCVARPL